MLSVSDFVQTLLNYMLLKNISIGLRGTCIKKNSTNNMPYLVILHLIMLYFSFRMYFCNSIIILNIFHMHDMACLVQIIYHCKRKDDFFLKLKLKNKLETDLFFF